METVTNDNAVLTLTEPAAQQVRSLLARDPDHAGKFLRVFVEGGGCSGLQYGMLFDEKRPEDLVIESQGVSVLVDQHSAGFLRGASIDFKDDLNDSGFKVLNPNARENCGCGKSFGT